MVRAIVWFVGAVLLFGKPVEAEQLLRTWSSESGKFTVQAELVDRSRDKIRLRKEGGQVITVALAEISAKDRRYVSKQLREARSEAQAKKFPNAVYRHQGQFAWKTSSGDQGSSPDLTVALQQAIGDGNRSVHVTVGGKLQKTIYLKPDLTLHFHGHTLVKDHDKTGFYQQGKGGIQIHDLTLQGGTGWGFHLSRASDLTFKKVHIQDSGIGMRIESHPSRPYEKGRWVRNLVVKDCSFDGCRSHGIETYGVEKIRMDGIVAKNCGECGVLINKGRDCQIGSVKAYRCCVGGGYAGLRFANNCSNSTVDRLEAIECGRGLFFVSNCQNIVVQHVTIRNCSSHAILIQHSDGVGINGGTYDRNALNHYTSKNCWIKATAAEAAPVGSKS